MDQKQQPSKRLDLALICLATGAFLGIVVIGLFSSFSNRPGIGTFGSAAMVAAASALAGGLLGFIFGVPKTLAQHKPDAETAERKATDEKDANKFEPNTNLEQISDWLTKILVGAGLTQLGNVKSALTSLGQSLKPAFGGSDAAPIFAIATVISYILFGFLVSYLWTRVNLPSALQQAYENLAQQIQEIRDQNDLDAKALTLALKQLTPAPGTTSPTQAELDDAIKDASSSVKAQIFYQARAIRAENWREPRTKFKMERTIPIFRALTHCDTDQEFHMNHGQLGFALKDQRTPDWAGAEKELNDAIAIRGSWKQHGFEVYEFNRAICRIMQDEGFLQKQPSSDPERITEDLKTAYGSMDLRGVVLMDPTVKAWCDRNGVQPKDWEKSFHAPLPPPSKERT